MVINSFTVSYLVISLILIASSSWMAVIAIAIAKRWKEGISSEDQYDLEKRAYLVTTVITLMLLTKIVMVPFWFLTLGSLIPSVPGAMCLAGIHMFRYPYSFGLSISKLIIPFIYLFWLVLNKVDRKIISMPFMKKKMFLFFPISILAVVESISDIVMLRSIKSRKVSCCSSLFDLPSDKVPEIITETTSVWLIAFAIGFIVTVLLCLWLILGKKRKTLFGFLSLSAFVSGTFFMLALHTKISPLFLQASFHHCIFCVWQNLPLATLVNILFFTGFWFAISASAIGLFFSHAGKDTDKIENEIRNMLKISAGVLLISGILFLGQYLFYAFK